MGHWHGPVSLFNTFGPLKIAQIHLFLKRMQLCGDIAALVGTERLKVRPRVERHELITVDAYVCRNCSVHEILDESLKATVDAY